MGSRRSSSGLVDGQSLGKEPEFQTSSKFNVLEVEDEFQTSFKFNVLAVVDSRTAHAEEQLSFAGAHGSVQD